MIYIYYCSVIFIRFNMSLGDLLWALSTKYNSERSLEYNQRPDVIARRKEQEDALTAKTAEMKTLIGMKTDELKSMASQGSISTNIHRETGYSQCMLLRQAISNLRDYNGLSISAYTTDGGIFKSAECWVSVNWYKANDGDQF